MKRKIGERAKILLDTIDQSILNKLSEKELGILELSREINISYKNLKPHINKLIKSHLIYTSKKGLKINLILSKSHIKKNILEILKDLR